MINSLQNIAEKSQLVENKIRKITDETVDTIQGENTKFKVLTNDIAEVRMRLDNATIEFSNSAFKADFQNYMETEKCGF